MPSSPGDAAGLMRAAIEDDGPVVFLEHKLLSRIWLDAMGGASRGTVSFDIPAGAAEGPVPDPIDALPIGEAAVLREGGDLTLVSLAVGVHRGLAAAELLAGEGVEVEVIDLRGTRPLDREAVVGSVRRTGRLLVVDEDYREGGLSGELAAACAEAGLPFDYRRVTTESTIPYDRERERETLPNVDRIMAAARELLAAQPA